jgi:peptidase C39-like protein
LRIGRSPLVALLTIAAAGVPFRRAAAAGASPVLQVPYVAQSELLCGGAAVAMVERWWGRRGVYAEEFASLVHREAGGILTTDLLAATRARGWDARAVDGTPQLIQQFLRDSIPVIALIKVGRDRYHYVVIVGWDSDVVTYHDPAVAPFVKSRASSFMLRWRGANSWMMVFEPAAPGIAVTPPVPPPTAATQIDSMPCRPWLDLAADAAAVNQLDQADRLLASAASACPAEPVVLRELAGVRFRQGRQPDATRLAAEYLRRVPSDTLGWQLLASSRYLSTDLNGALDAWNAIGRPAVDLLRVDGLAHMRFAVVADALNTPARQPLTSRALQLAQRRIADLPTVAASRVSYVAVPGGTVEVRAAVIERPVLDPIPQLVIGNALRAAVRSEVAVEVNSPLGAGEQWTAQWRWERADPRRALRLDLPAHIGILGIRGIATVEGSDERYHFSAALPDQQRRTTAVALEGWLTPKIEVVAAARVEQWVATGNYVAFRGGAAVHPLGDRTIVMATAEQAISTGAATGYRRASIQASWTAGNDRTTTWSARGGIDWVSAATPAGLWPIAGGDLARAIPLRAHHFIVMDALPTERSGRTVWYGGASADHIVAMLGPAEVGVGVFADAANIGATSAGVAQRWYLDTGGGVRIGLPGATSGALRIDLARGVLADPRWGVTVGYSFTESLRRTHVR